MNDVVLEVKNLDKTFTTGVFTGKKIKAVQNVSFNVKKGEIVSLIGESGSGKTTVGKLILQLIHRTGGDIIYKNKNIDEFKKNKKTYYKNVQGIFQDPFASFNPLYKIDRVFDMVFSTFLKEKENKKDIINKSLNDVGLNPSMILGKYPHQLSGGQLQRILIARALVMDVDLLVADELISMLDASTRIDVLNLLSKLAKEKGMAVIFITHDLSLGYYISDKTLIMYKGKIVEQGNTIKIYENPVHPYTKMLMLSVPKITNKWDRKKKFLPEMIEKEVQNFTLDGKTGFVEVEEDHIILV